MRTCSRLVLLLIPTLVVGCEAGHTVVIDLITDLEPGVELSEVRTEVLSSSGGTSSSMPALFGEDFLSGRRIAELANVPGGSTTTRVLLIAPDGTTVLARTVVAEVAGDTGFTVVATRSCASVSCPTVGDDVTQAACLGGRCVDERCTVESSEFCGTPGCMVDADCGPASVPCARQACIAGECLHQGQDAMCAAAEYCDVTLGCVMRPGDVDSGVDSGMPPVDASGATLTTFGEDGTADVAGVTTDTYLLSASPTFNSGEDVSLVIEAGESTALLRFDISSIPATATVVSAELEIWTNFSPSQGGMANLYVASESWEESSATWTERASGMPWSTPGADLGARGALLGSITTTNDMFFESLETRLVLDPAVVQSWVSTPADNHGVIIAPVTGYVGLLSSEAVLIENAPILHVQHSP